MIIVSAIGSFVNALYFLSKIALISANKIPMANDAKAKTANF